MGAYQKHDDSFFSDQIALQSANLADIFCRHIIMVKETEIKQQRIGGII